MGNSRNSWKKKLVETEEVSQKAPKRTNKRANNPDPVRKGQKDSPDIAAIPKVGTLRQWDKNMKTEARIRRRPNGVAVRTNPDPVPVEKKPKNKSAQ